MAKTTKTDPVSVSTNATYPVTIDEFCRDLSKSDGRPEMVYAFSKDEMRNGRIKDMPENYSARYAAFCGRKV